MRAFAEKVFLRLQLDTTWGQLGVNLGQLGSTWDQLVANLGQLVTNLGQLGPTWNQLVANLGHHEDYGGNRRMSMLKSRACQQK